jgi:hypothetical protein
MKNHSVKKVNEYKSQFQKKGAKSFLLYQRKKVAKIAIALH